MSPTHSYHWLWSYFSRLQHCRFQLKILCCYRIKFRLHDCWLDQVDRERTTIFEFHACSREINDIFAFLKKILMLTFSWTSLKARSFKLCMFIILLGVQIFILGLMTLTFFKVTDVSEIWTANGVFWTHVLCSSNVVWFMMHGYYAHKKDEAQYPSCDWCVCKRHIQHELRIFALERELS